jgi:hypothetical protein
MFTTAREPMRFSQSPITWVVATLLFVASALASLIFIRTDLGFGAVGKPVPSVTAPMSPASAPQAALYADDRPTMLIVAIGNDVKIQEFSNMEKCSEAATYIRVGTERRATAQCVSK